MNYKLIFIIHIAIYSLVLTGVIPRETILIWATLLVPIFIKLGYKESLLFFIAAITTSIALPISYSFDSLSLWRPLSLLILLLFFYENRFDIRLVSEIKKTSPIMKLLLVFIVLTLISLLFANDTRGGLKRILFFANMSLPAILIYIEAKKDSLFIGKTINAIIFSVFSPLFFGLVQLTSTYLIDIYEFIILWGEKIQLRLYGKSWAETAVKANTWFAYFGDQLSLRLFSTFPDSHSMPIYMILALPAIFMVGLKKQSLKIKDFLLNFDKKYLTVLFMVLFFAILSGTRGIWASGIILLSIGFIFSILKKSLKDLLPKDILSINKFIFTSFIALFAIAYPIFASSQFQVNKEKSDQILIRIRSIIDLEETSNNARLYIWRETAKSIITKPLLGVGIYNFPEVLKQKTELTKAGSSAHNIYLHIAAEIGIPALIIMLSICFLIIKDSFLSLRTAIPPKLKIFLSVFIITSIWIGIYSLTDFALFDERTFILLLINIALARAIDSLPKPSRE